MSRTADEKILAAARTAGTLFPALHALRTYTRRACRAEHPEGRQDGGGRWYPSGADAAALDGSIRAPSRTWPWSYMIACRSLAHCERLHGADHGTVLAARRLMKALDYDAERAPELPAWMDAQALASAPASTTARRRA